MPGPTGLKLVKRKGSVTWYVRGTVRGQIVFESAGTTDRASAESFRAVREAELYQRAVFGTRATIGFAEAVISFVSSKSFSPADKKRLDQLVVHFKTEPLDKIDQEKLDRAYQVLLPANASAANKLRTVLAPLRAVLNHAARRGWCNVPKFEIPAQKPPRVAFLRPDQATALIQAAALHLRPLLAFCLFTGARMSEALELDWQDLDLAAGRVVFRKTKNARERHYDMPAAAVAALGAIPGDRRGHVFQVPAVVTKRGLVVAKAHPYQNNGRQAGGQIKTGWRAACRRAGITGIRPHDMRHTWATWHYCLHKDLLLLRNEGGWQSIDQVEIYAHKIPNAYQTQIESLLAGTPAEPVKKEA